uniref:Uncharacterized protein n=1 Tax=Arundo donax TaxID=35708 RepID=A0A0A9ABG5_ARUDO
MRVNKQPQTSRPTWQSPTTHHSPDGTPNELMISRA